MFTGTPTAEHRVMLVELLNSDPFDQHRSEYYPFVQGYLRERGATTRWVLLAAGRESRPEHPYVVEPSPKQRERLLAAVESFRPSHVLINEKLGPDCLRALRALDSVEDVVEPPRRFVSDEIEEAVPDYAQERLDPGELTAEHLVPLVVEPRCIYNRSVCGNPHFMGLDVAELRHARGCSFCVNDRRRLEMSSEQVVDRVLLQLERYRETVPAGRRRRRFSLLSSAVFLELGGFLERFLALELWPAQLYLTCRVDELLRSADSLRAQLPALERRGHELCFWQIGLENFSAVENERFNKRISPAQIDEAIALLTELEASWPRSLSFQRHGGFATILFTPWTTLADLRTNLAGVRRHDIQCDLTTRLMLRAQTPLEVLAARDNLIVEADDAPDSFGTYCIKHWGEGEIPWRFQSRQVAAVYRLLRSASSRAAGAVARDPTRTLEALIELVASDPDATDEVLARRLEGRLGVEGEVCGEPAPELVRLAVALRERGARLGDYVIRGDVAVKGGELEVNLAGGGSPLALLVTLAQQTPRCYASAGFFAISHRESTPPETAAQRDAIRAFAGLLEQIGNHA